MVIGGYDKRLNKPGSEVAYTPTVISSGWFRVKVRQTSVGWFVHRTLVFAGSSMVAVCFDNIFHVLGRRSDSEPLSGEPAEDSTLLELQSRFGDTPLEFQVVCPQNGTAVLKDLTHLCRCLWSFWAAASWTMFSSLVRGTRAFVFSVNMFF